MAEDNMAQGTGVNTKDATATDSAAKDNASPHSPEAAVEDIGTHATEESAPAKLANGDNAEVEGKGADESTDDKAQQNGEATPTKDASAVDAAPATSTKKNQKRKSTGSVPEHKTKKPVKRKSMPSLHLDVQPGEFWFAIMKGYPPWPCVICEEDMLPISLIEKRPVSAKQADGNYRADFEEGGKNARDRRYPVMFLHTNEFAWQVNTDLQPLDMDDVKAIVEKDDKGKRAATLWEAYKVAAEEHDLDWFRSMLLEHEEGLREAEEEQEKKDAEKAEKAKKAADKKTKKSAPAKDEDVEMEDASGEEVKAPKSASKKRKKEAAEGDEEEGAKPAKTPKTIKINGPKSGEEASAAKKNKTPKEKTTKEKTKTPKSKTKESKETPSEPELTEEQKREKREKMVLYLRHKLQKGFLTRDKKPQEEEMDAMDQQFKQLEGINDLEAQIITTTKINKVLKAVIKLAEIPREAEYKFKERSQSLLNKWAPALGLSSEGATKTETPAPTTNGVNHDDKEKTSDGEEAKKAEDKSDAPEADETKEEAKTEEVAAEA